MKDYLAVFLMLQMYVKPELLISTDVPSLSQANSISCFEFYDYIVR